MKYLHEYEEYRNLNEGIIGDAWTWLKNLVKQKILKTTDKEKISDNLTSEEKSLIDDITRFLEYIKKVTLHYRFKSSKEKEIAYTENYVYVGTKRYGLTEKAVNLILNKVCGPQTNTLFRFAFMPESLDSYVANSLYTDILLKNISSAEMINYNKKIKTTPEYLKYKDTSFLKTIKY